VLGRPGYARRRAGARRAVDGPAQGTLLPGLDNRHLSAPGSDMRAWPFSGVHSVHNMFLSQERSGSSDIGSGSDAFPDRGMQMQPSRRIELSEARNALLRIPAEQRDVLLLVVVQRMSYAKTAEALGVPVATVMSRLSRARESLRRQLAGDAPPRQESDPERSPQQFL
jgi:RNA polymerase sigma-70 factor (ECF subfamily)